VTADNLARGGLTSAGLLAQASARRLRADQGQVTVITIGANDFDSTLLSRPGYRAGDDLTGYQPAMQALRRNLSRLLATLASAGAADHGPVLVTGYWNVFLDGRVGAGRGAAYQRDSDALTRKVNGVLAAAARSAHAVYIDLYTPFKGHGERDDTPLLADDGDHPSDLGHRLIARMVQQSLVHEGASAA
jgi:lysophospholipase L1-like esterase